MFFSYSILIDILGILKTIYFNKIRKNIEFDHLYILKYVKI